MSQLVVLNFAKGSLQRGFPEVTAQLWEGGSALPTQFTGSLPASLELLELYQKWRSLYEALHARLNLRRTRTLFEIDEADITNVSEAEFNQLCQQIKSQLNRWLNSDGFGKVERQLRANLSRSTEIRVVVTTEDPYLRKFPWHLWNFFEDYPYAEIALGTQNYEPPRPPRRSSTKLVKILAVLGNSEGIDTHRDREFLDQLPSAGTVFLAEPPRWELNHRLWDEKGWDILFFAGHSASQVDGRSGEIAINQTESLTVDQLKNALRAAIARGLKLAIFNSCDGLGLARAMADLNIPQLIVMREPVPDRVAQEFLKHFLTAFSGGKSLYQSVREAREKLEGMEDEFPSASWLPVICQNPAEVPPTWAEMLGVSARQIPVKPSKQDLRVVLLASVAVSALISGMRFSGIEKLRLLEFWEFKAFDHLMQLRPAEDPDPHLLIIKNTETDVLQDQVGRQGSISNRRLAQLLDKLDQYEPALIGLDIYRGFPVESQYQNLVNHYKQNDKLITVCKVGEDPEPSSPPPPDILKDDLVDQVGASDVDLDSDGFIRRHLLSLAVPKQSPCQVGYTFSALIAVTYLEKQGFTFQQTSTDDLQTSDSQQAKLLLKMIRQDNQGIYHAGDTGGLQLLLNYRAANPIATELTVGEALEGNKLSTELVKGRIVLIGTTAKSFGDLEFTPHTRNSLEQMPGVVVQAHMISQIIQAAMNGRPLLWLMPIWSDILWIWTWSLVGGVVAWRSRSLGMGVLREGVAIAVLYGCCYILLLQGGWIPLVPSMLALIGGGGTVTVYRYRQTIHH
jgi:CHASE2 domain-containing sensor protein